MPSNPTYCNNVPSTCCPGGIPMTLYATVNAPSACFGGTQATATLNFDGTNWTGTVAGGSCGQLTMTYIVSVGPGGVCTSTARINKSDGTLCTTSVQVIPTPCPHFEALLLIYIWDGTGCGCCGGSSMSITVSA